jgi:hypothetical protein
MTTTTGPDETGLYTVTTDRFAVRIRPRREPEGILTAMFVDGGLAEREDTTYADLCRRESELGELRNCVDVAHGGDHPEVDALYVEMNARYMLTCLAIARAVLPLLADLVEGDLNDAVENARFNLSAGCDMCPCSPGVSLPGPLTIGGAVVDIWVDNPASPL